jgi:hypothetical protein
MVETIHPILPFRPGDHGFFFLTGKCKLCGKSNGDSPGRYRLFTGKEPGKNASKQKANSAIARMGSLPL